MASWLMCIKIDTYQLGPHAVPNRDAGRSLESLLSVGREGILGCAVEATVAVFHSECSVEGEAKAGAKQTDGFLYTPTCGRTGNMIVVELHGTLRTILEQDVPRAT